MVKLRAEEKLTEILVNELSNGTSFKPVDRSEIINEMKRQAGFEKKKRKMDKEQTKIMLAAMGIGVRCQAKR